jgi:hypothetical protein
LALLLDAFAAEESTKIPGAVNHPQDVHALRKWAIEKTRSASSPGYLMRERHPMLGCVAIVSVSVKIAISLRTSVSES